MTSTRGLSCLGLSSLWGSFFDGVEWSGEAVLCWMGFFGFLWVAMHMSVPWMNEWMVLDSGNGSGNGNGSFETWY